MALDFIMFASVGGKLFSFSQTTLSGVLCCVWQLSSYYNTRSCVIISRNTNHWLFCSFVCECASCNKSKMTKQNNASLWCDNNVMVFQLPPPHHHPQLRLSFSIFTNISRVVSAFVYVRTMSICIGVWCVMYVDFYK